MLASRCTLASINYLEVSLYHCFFRFVFVSFPPVLICSGVTKRANMSSEEISEDTLQQDSSPNPKDNAFFEPKPKPKVIRVLTVLAYILSVSMAAILLSIYYIFMWDGQPHLGARVSYNSNGSLSALKMMDTEQVEEISSVKEWSSDYLTTTKLANFVQEEIGN